MFDTPEYSAVVGISVVGAVAVLVVMVGVVVAFAGVEVDVPEYVSWKRLGIVRI